MGGPHPPRRPARPAPPSSSRAPDPKEAKEKEIVKEIVAPKAEANGKADARAEAKAEAKAEDAKKAAQKTQALDLALTTIEKAYGRGSIMRLGKAGVVEIQGISTSSLSLDFALGGRGVPRGRIS